MAKTKTPRTTSPRSKKNGTDHSVTPVVATASETPTLEVHAEAPSRPEIKTPEPKTPASQTSVAKTAEVKPEIKAVETKEPRKTLSEVRRTVVPINLEEEIRRRAYQLYEERGCTPGHENDDWLVAEREILMRYTAQRQHSA